MLRLPAMCEATPGEESLPIPTWECPLRPDSVDGEKGSSGPSRTVVPEATNDAPKPGTMRQRLGISFSQLMEPILVPIDAPVVWVLSSGQS